MAILVYSGMEPCGALRGLHPPLWKVPTKILTEKLRNSFSK